LAQNYRKIENQNNNHKRKGFDMIDKLTEEQEAQIPVYRDRYIELGFSTTRIDPVAAQSAIDDLYEHLFKKEKVKIMIFRSPNELWNYVCETIGEKINFIAPYLCGSLDSFVFSFYDYFLEVADIKIEPELLQKYEIWKKTMDLGYIYPFDDVCLLSEKPIKYMLNKNILHCENGPAIEFADGWSIYMLNGVRMKKEYVMTPWNELDPTCILKETNAEVRRELVRKIGIERVCDSLGSEVLDTEGDYELISLDLGDGRRRPYLKMKNPSIGVYHIEGVPPETKTVAAAIEFRNGTKERPSIIT
jgi:hypothetical protein